MEVLGESELLCMLRGNTQLPNPRTLKHTWDEYFLWNIMNFGFRSCDQSITRDSSLPLGTIPPAPSEYCFFSQLTRKEQASGSHFNSPTVPQTPSASPGPQIPDTMLDFLGDVSE